MTRAERVAGAGGSGGAGAYPHALIRPERAGDRGDIARVVAAAFGSPAEAALVDATRASPQYVPELSLVAEDGGQTVGHVMISHVELDDGRARHRVASLSPLAVHPGFQRRGTGSALVRTAIAAADGLGEPVVVLEGDPAYYARFGFEHAARYGIQIDLPSWAPPEAAQARPLTAYGPTVRGRVVYPPAFDRVTGE